MIQDSLVDIVSNSEAIIGQYFLLLYITPIFFVLLKYTKDVFLLSRKLKHIQQEKSNAEINFLKAQVHPHFLFNTLNNIYTLTLKESPKAATASQTLARILEYMTISSAQGLTLLNDEIQLIDNYIELEKLRYGDRLQLSVTVDIDKDDYKIHPLLLLPFIENAFKHGVSNDPQSPKLNVSISVVNGSLKMVVENSVVSNQAKDDNNYRGGIGIKNVKNQLNLLYPDAHSLTMRGLDNSYKILLDIHLEDRKADSVFSKYKLV